MSIEPGAKLGRYEIRAQIGEGGMGEVYSAYNHISVVLNWTAGLKK